MPMRLQSVVLVLAVSVSVPMTALAGEDDFFAGLDLLGGVASGSSSTRDGGAPFAGGGVVDDVRFGETTGIGGHMGYRFAPDLAVSISYQHIRGDIGWNANFPLYGVSSGFEGSATSDAVIGSIAYETPLSDATVVRGTAGLGISFNSLSGVVETDRGSGLFLADVADHTKISPVAQVGAGLRHKITPNVALGLDALFAYSGGFETGNTRSGNLGVTDINPYRIDRVWRANIGASIRIAF